MVLKPGSASGEAAIPRRCQLAAAIHGVSCSDVLTCCACRPGAQRPAGGRAVIQASVIPLGDRCSTRLRADLQHALPRCPAASRWLRCRTSCGSGRRSRPTSRPCWARWRPTRTPWCSSPPQSMRCRHAGPALRTHRSRSAGVLCLPGHACALRAAHAALPDAASALHEIGRDQTAARWTAQRKQSRPTVHARLQACSTAKAPCAACAALCSAASTDPRAAQPHAAHGPSWNRAGAQFVRQGLRASCLSAVVSPTLQTSTHPCLFSCGAAAQAPPSASVCIQRQPRHAGQGAHLGGEPHPATKAAAAARQDSLLCAHAAG